MPEDTRVQQQVHVHIWMEADIIRVIVSDARRAVKVTLDVLGRKFWMLKIQKIHGSRRAASAEGDVEPRAIRQPGAIRHENTIPS
jgi:hypothetical protein